MQIVNRKVDIPPLALATILMPCLASLSVLGIDGSLVPEISKYFLFYVAAVIPASYCAGRITLNKYNLNFLEQLILGYPIAILAMAICFVVSKSLDQMWIAWIVPISAYILIFRNSKPNSRSTNHSAKTKPITYLKIISIYLISATLLFSTFTLTTDPTNPLM